MRSRLTLPALALVAITAVLPLHAQTTLAPRRDEDVRYRLASDTTAPWIVGRMLDLTPTYLELRHEFGREEQISFDAFHRLQVQRGTHWREGAWVGAILGVAIGLIGGDSASERFLLAGSLAVGLGVTGAGAGHQYPRWVDVDLGYLRR